MTPTTKLSEVLEEACAHFKLESKNCTLVRKKNTLDLSMPFRLSRLSSNENVELVYNSGTKAISTTSKLAQCKIALKVDDSSLVNSFPHNLTLLEMVTQFVETNPDKFPANILSELNPEIVYLQSSFPSEKLATTTLQHLGLGGKSTRLTLRYDKTETAPSPRSSSTNANQKETAVVEQDQAPLSVFAAVNDSMEIATNSTTNSSKSVDVQALLDNVLSQNFDAVTIPAIIIMTKYLYNILANPDEAKYRNIILTNKTFVEKVSPAKGALDFLSGVGFVRTSTQGKPSLCLSMPATQASMQQHIAGIKTAASALENAMQELNVPMEDRPNMPQPKVIPTTNGNNAQAFDPFKTFVRRVADMGPDGNMTLADNPFANSTALDGKSATELKLENLQQRRLDLEGKKDEVSRNTVLIYPGGQQQATNAMDVVESDPSDSKLLAQTLKGALKQEDAPLTTAALRSLEKAKTEKVYRETMIRVKLPDRLILQGSFHPRHELVDVYEWMLQSLNTTVVSTWNAIYAQLVAEVDASASDVPTASHLKRSSTKTPKKGQRVNPYPFELYVSPPLRTLPYEIGSNDEKKSLHDHNMVPSGVIFLRWINTDVENIVKEMSRNVPASYLHDDLVNLSGSKTSASDRDESRNLPRGVDLVQNKESASNGAGLKSSISDIVADGKSDTSQSSGTAKKSGKAPKWFKL